MTTTVIKEWFNCPWTGDDVLVSIPPAMSAKEFCPTCEFPMFWSHKVVGRVEQQQAIEDAWAEDGKNPPAAEVAAPLPPPPPFDLPEPQPTAKSTWYWPTVLAFILLALLIVLVLIMLIQLVTGA